MKKFLFLTLALLCGSVLNYPTQAQIIYGSISSAISDQNGAAISAAAITEVNSANGTTTFC